MRRHDSSSARRLWTRWLDETGANLMETALAVLLIGLVAIAAISYMGRSTGELWDQVPASFNQNNTGGGGGSGGGGGGTGGGGGGSGGGGGGSGGGGGGGGIDCDVSVVCTDPGG